MMWPPPDYQVDETLVRHLVDEQFEEFEGDPLHYVGEGFDNSLWRLGDTYLVRLPRRAISVRLMENEIKWLPILQSRLPLPVSVPYRVGVGTENYPCPWVITRWFEGSSGDVIDLVRTTEVARGLGRFLASLHHQAPSEAPFNILRGIALQQRNDSFEQRLQELEKVLDASRVRKTWKESLAARPMGSPPVWLHGDLHPANVIVSPHSLNAVVDFGDLCKGDPATDIAGAWMLLPNDDLPTFFDAYGPIDDDLYHRSRGWATLFSLFFISLGREGRPQYERIGRQTLERVTSS
jgi:aminoglycoside phosphotransferase (APT) family kinase protein